MFVAIATIALSIFLVAGNLRMIAQETMQTIVVATGKARASGNLVQKSAFATLWVMIFALSCL